MILCLDKMELYSFFCSLIGFPMSLNGVKRINWQQLNSCTVAGDLFYSVFILRLHM